MVKKRAKVSEAVAEMGGLNPDLFASTGADSGEKAAPAAPVKPGGSGRVLYRASYDMTAELKTAVAQRATRLGIPASQLAMFLLSDALRRLDSGDIDPAPFLVESESPKFRFNLALDADWYFEE
jgi:hypothetical protein